LFVALGPGSPSFALGPGDDSWRLRCAPACYGRVAVQVGAFVAEPVLGLLETRHGAGDQLPEAGVRGFNLAQGAPPHAAGGHSRARRGGARISRQGERQETACRARAPSGSSGRANVMCLAPPRRACAACQPTRSSRSVCAPPPPAQFPQPARRHAPCGPVTRRRGVPCAGLSMSHHGMRLGAGPMKRMRCRQPRSGMVAPSASGTGTGNATQTLAHPVDMGLEKLAGLLDAGIPREPSPPPPDASCSLSASAAARPACCRTSTGTPNAPGTLEARRSSPLFLLSDCTLLIPSYRLMQHARTALCAARCHEHARHCWA